MGAKVLVEEMHGFRGIMRYERSGSGVINGRLRMLREDLLLLSPCAEQWSEEQGREQDLWLYRLLRLEVQVEAAESLGSEIPDAEEDLRRVKGELGTAALHVAELWAPLAAQLRAAMEKADRHGPPRKAARLASELATVLDTLGRASSKAADTVLQRIARLDDHLHSIENGGDVSRCVAELDKDRSMLQSLSGEATAWKLKQVKLLEDLLTGNLPEYRRVPLRDELEVLRTSLGQLADAGVAIKRREMGVLQRRLNKVASASPVAKNVTDRMLACEEDYHALLLESCRAQLQKLWALDRQLLDPTLSANQLQLAHTAIAEARLALGPQCYEAAVWLLFKRESVEGGARGGVVADLALVASHAAEHCAGLVQQAATRAQTEELGNRLGALTIAATDVLGYEESCLTQAIRGGESVAEKEGQLGQVQDALVRHLRVVTQWHNCPTPDLYGLRLARAELEAMSCGDQGQTMDVRKRASAVCKRLLEAELDSGAIANTPFPGTREEHAWAAAVCAVDTSELLKRRLKAGAVELELEKIRDRLNALCWEAACFKLGEVEALTQALRERDSSRTLLSSVARAWLERCLQTAHIHLGELCVRAAQGNLREPETGADGTDDAVERGVLFAAAAECCGREVWRLQVRLFKATVTDAPKAQQAKLRKVVDLAERDQLKLASKAGCWLLQASEGLGQELDALEDGSHIDT
jgi:hypothetical protein